jgi:hypothetical protein
MRNLLFTVGKVFYFVLLCFMELDKLDWSVYLLFSFFCHHSISYVRFTVITIGVTYSTYRLINVWGYIFFLFVMNGGPIIYRQNRYVRRNFTVTLKKKDLRKAA